MERIEQWQGSAKEVAGYVLRAPVSSEVSVKFCMYQFQSLNNWYNTWCLRRWSGCSSVSSQLLNFAQGCCCEESLNAKVFCWMKGGGITATVHQKNNCVSNQVIRSKENLWGFRASANEWVLAICAPTAFPTKPAAGKQSDIQLVRQKRTSEEGNISVPICTGNLIQWCLFSEEQGKAGISKRTFKVLNRMPASTLRHNICGTKMTCS